MRSYLDDIPGARSTLARRARAVYAMHRSAGLEVPYVTGKEHYDRDVVARALQQAPIGGWPTGFVGRRDAALVALVCVAGLTRDQARQLRASSAGHALGRLAVAEAPGSCPRCALTRWLRAHSAVTLAGWRSVRVELEDIGVLVAGMEQRHDCALALLELSTSAPVFVAIDRNGQPGVTPLSSRSISAVISLRLAGARGSRPVGEPTVSRSLGPAERSKALRRLDELCAVMERAEEALTCTWAIGARSLYR